MECLLWNPKRSSLWYFISYVGVLPECCTGMGQTLTPNVTRHYQGATLWDKGKTKWVPLLINELVKDQSTSQKRSGYNDSTPKWIGNWPPNTESVNMYPKHRSAELNNMGTGLPIQKV